MVERTKGQTNGPSYGGRLGMVAGGYFLVLVTTLCVVTHVQTLRVPTGLQIGENVRFLRRAWERDEWVRPAGLVACFLEIFWVR